MVFDLNLKNCYLKDSCLHSPFPPHFPLFNLNLVRLHFGLVGNIYLEQTDFKYNLLTGSSLVGSSLEARPYLPLAWSFFEQLPCSAPIFGVSILKLCLHETKVHPIYDYTMTVL